MDREVPHATTDRRIALFHPPDGDPESRQIKIEINLRAAYITFLLVAFAVCALGVFGAWR